MNLLQWLGTLALSLGGSVLVSAFILGQDLLSELTGFPLGPLYGGCLITVVLGAIAVQLGRQDEQEHRHDTEKGNT